MNSLLKHQTQFLNKLAKMLVVPGIKNLTLKTVEKTESAVKNKPTNNLRYKTFRLSRKIPSTFIDK
jgi:hypothetical protein